MTAAEEIRAETQTPHRAEARAVGRETKGLN
jgi:hypothetical protein